MKKNTVSAYCGFFVALLFCYTILLGCEGQGVGIKPEGGKMMTDFVEEVPEGAPEFVTGEDVQTPGTWEGLSAETEKRIIQDYFNIVKERSPYHPWVIKNADRMIYQYYGSYNGYHVVTFGMSPLTVGWGTEIGGIVFYSGSPPDTILANYLGFLSSRRGMIPAWKDGRFYDIVDLYADGLLTRDDIIQIADRWGKTYGLRAIIN
jgi:hypothetical protein